MNKYESIIIVDSKVDEAGLKALEEKYTSMINEHGKVESVENMGLKTKYYIGLLFGIATFVAAYNAYAADTGSETAATQAADNKGSLTDYIQNEKRKSSGCRK